MRGCRGYVIVAKGLRLGELKPLSTDETLNSQQTLILAASLTNYNSHPLGTHEKSDTWLARHEVKWLEGSVKVSVPLVVVRGIQSQTKK